MITILNTLCSRIPPSRKKTLCSKHALSMSLENFFESITLSVTLIRPPNSPDDLKNAEMVLFQTRVFYESWAQSLPMKLRRVGVPITTQDSYIDVAACQSQDDFASKLEYASRTIRSGRQRAGWRLLHETMDVVKFADAVVNDIEEHIGDDGKIDTFELTEIVIGNIPEAVRAWVGKDKISDELKDLDKDEAVIIATESAKVIQKLVKLFTKK